MSRNITIFAVGLTLFVLSYSRAFGINASPDAVVVSQPDGSDLRLFVRGDEYLNWYEDERGFSVLRDGDRYVYANRDAGGRLVPTAYRVGEADPVRAGLTRQLKPSKEAGMEARFQRLSPAERTSAVQGPSAIAAMDAPSGVTPASGTVKNLVVLCKFSDHDSTKIRPESEYDHIFNSVGGHPTLAPTGSVKDYFAETSYGTVTLDSTVVAWVTLPNTEAYYANGSDGLGSTYPMNGQGMTKDALDLVDGLVDFGSFDSNLDGFIDAITVIHSGYAAETGGGGGNWIWSHKWSLWAVPGGNWASQDNNSNGVKVKVYDYHTEAALWSTSGTGITRIGVICHELGHFFGLPDLYDTDGSSQGIGSYCLMSNSWGFDGSQRYPPHFSAWCKIKLGWIDSTVISGGTRSLPRVMDNRTVYRVNTGYPSNEYLLIENRQPAGFESIMPQGGLAIWHIDDAKSGNTAEGYPGQSGWPTNGNHYKVALLQADGLFEMEKNFNRGNAGDVYRGGGVSSLTPSTTPNTDRYQGGTVAATSNSITGISTPSSVMSFTLSNTLFPSITSALTASGTQNSAFSYQIAASNSPTSYSASGLPGGLSVNLSTGLISGLPVTGGTSSVLISANNASGTCQQTLTIVIDGVIGDPDITVHQPEGSPLISGETAVNFGETLVSSRLYRRFAVRNEGVNPLALGTPYLTGPHAGDFAIGSLTTSSLLPQSTAYLDVTFLAGGGGARTAFLHFPSDDPDTPDLAVPISGEGTVLNGGIELTEDLVATVAGLNPTNVLSMEDYILFYANTPQYGNELWRSDGTAAGTYLVRDCNVGTSGTIGGPMAKLGSLAFFGAFNSAAGTELWVTDGTEGGTVLLKDINPGSSSSTPNNLTVVGSTLYFTAVTTATGTELWKSDGTAAGTVVVADINSGTNSSNPANLRSLNGGLIFTASTSAAGTELWKTDGTAAGTQIVLDISAGSSSSSPSNLTVVGSSVYFSATTTASGGELWKSDGTSVGTVMVTDIFPGVGGSFPTNLLNLDGVLLFSANQSGLGPELWKSDGTGPGTVLVKDINPGSLGSSPTSAAIHNGRAYFSATSGTVFGSELWASDGTAAGTVMVADLYPGSSSSTPTLFRSVGTTLFFSAFTSSGRELWKTDGTEPGTMQVRDIYPEAPSSSPTQLIQLGSLLLFTANDGQIGQELWRSDGSFAGTYPVGDVVKGTNSTSFSNMSNVDGALYISASDGVIGTELWRRGSAAGPTTLVKDIWPGSLNSFPSSFTGLGNLAVFSAGGSSTGNEPMVSDGTSAGTVSLGDLNPGSSSSTPNSFTTVGNRTFFAATEPVNGTELWSTDGTPGGTGLVANIFPSSSSSLPSSFFNFRGKLVFRATDSTSGSELWTSDGSQVGTIRIADIAAGAGSSNPSVFVTMNGLLYFNASTSAEGAELWKSDGTAPGTSMVTSISPGISSSSPSNLTVVDSTVYFAAATSGTGTELWKSDGTAGGTSLVRDIRSGASGSSPSNLIAMNGLLYFLADDGVNGRELWRSDGTSAGTYLVKDMNPGSPGNLATALVRMRDVFYCLADDGAHGRELWKSDGTEAGTAMVEDLLPGPSSSEVGILTAVGPRIYFKAFHPDSGTELFSIAHDHPAELKITYPAGTPLTSESSSLEFDQISVGSSQSHTLTLQNGGTNRLAISSFSITGPDADEFQASNLSQSVLFGNDLATLDVVYTPATIGAKTATLHVFSDDPSEPDYSIALEVPKIDQTITFAPLADQLTTAAVVLSASGGGSGNPVTFAVTSGPGNITGGTTLAFTGAGQVTITASQAGNDDYHAAPDVARTFTVTKATAPVNLTGLGQTYSGSPRSVAATTSPGGLTVNITYAGSSTAPIDAGSYAVSGTIDDAIYEGSASGTLVVGKASQTINFGTIDDQVATAAVPLSATGGDSGNGVTFAVTDGPGVITGGNSLSFIGAGAVTITASQAGNGNFDPAPSVPRTFNVTKAAAMVNLTGLNQTYTGSPRAAGATTTPGGLTVNFTYDGSGTAPVDAGEYTVVGTISDAIYEGSASGTLVVAKAGQTITFGAIADQLANAQLTLSATGGASGLPVTFAVTDGPGVITGGTSLSFIGAGAVTITASQAGNGNYDPAPSVPRTFNVTKVTATVNLTGLNQTYTGSPREAGATATPGGLTVNFTYNGSSTAPVNAGEYAVVGTISDAIYEGSASGTLVVGKASQTITFGAIADQLADAEITLAATGGGSGNPVTFAVAGGPAQINGTTLTFTGAGEVTITASQTGNANYFAASDVSRTFAVTRATAALTITELHQVYDGTPREVLVTTVPPELDFSLMYDGEAEAPLGIGVYTVSAVITDPRYEGAADGTLTVDDPARMDLVSGGQLSPLSDLGTLNVATFQIARYEVTWGFWRQVRDWAAANGYDIGTVGMGCEDDHPVHSLHWFDAIKWCNARTEWENAMFGRSLAPAYRIAGMVYRSGEPPAATIDVDESVSGYRLPDAAEWEFAARGGLLGTGPTYPGGNILDPLGWFADNSAGAHCGLSGGRGTWPAGRKTANELGLYDLAGNVAEWTWDADPGNASSRLVLGGSWNSAAPECELGSLGSGSPSQRIEHIGLRVARSVSAAMAGALDNDTLIWNSGGDQPWFAQTSVTFDNVDAAQSGSLGENEQSWVETSVTGPGNLSFRCKSDIGGMATLRFTMNGQEQLFLNGDTDWTQHSFETPEGVTVLRWTFTRGAGIEANDSAWLDEVVHTLATEPTLSMVTATDVAETTATVGGAVTDSGGRAVTVRGIVWSTNPNPTVDEGTVVESGSGEGNFEVSLSGLAPGTTHHVRAFATNAIGTGYGPEIYFTTDETVPLTSGIETRNRVILPGDRHVFHFTLSGPRHVSLSSLGGASLRAKLYDGEGNLVASFDGDSDFDLDRLLYSGDYSLHVFRELDAGPSQTYALTLDASVVAFPRPDIAVGASPVGLVGAGVFLPSGQSISLTSRKARAAGGYVSVGNAGNLPDAITVSATPGSAFFAVSYTGPTGNVTAGIVSGTFTTDEIVAEDDPVLIRATISPNKRKLTKKTKRGSTILRKSFTSNIRASSTFDPNVVDSAGIHVMTR